jgi:hypothetical protein
MAMKRTVAPAPLGVVGLVPDEVGPIADADDEIVDAVAVVIDVAPHVRTDAVFVDVGLGVDLRGLLKLRFAEVHVLDAGGEDAGLAADVGDLQVVRGGAEADAGFEDGHFFSGLARVLEIPDAVGGFVRAGNEQVGLAVTVVVHRHGPGPEPDAEIDDEAGVVVLQWLEAMPRRRSGGPASGRMRNMGRSGISWRDRDGKSWEV